MLEIFLISIVKETTSYIFFSGLWQQHPQKCDSLVLKLKKLNHSNNTKINSDHKCTEILYKRTQSYITKVHILGHLQLNKYNENIISTLRKCCYSKKLVHYYCHKESTSDRLLVVLVCISGD